jgi:Holliday junction DNA helicase RuvB
VVKITEGELKNMANDIEREDLIRYLTGNPVARRIAERALQLEMEAIEKGKSGELKYPWPGFEWHEVPAQTQTLNQLVVDGLLVTGGRRGTFKSNSSQTYKLINPELVRECLSAIQETEEDTSQAEIPTNLFDFIIGYEDLKALFWRSINSEQPVHVLLIGPPACAKSMFLGELARLPFSRFANGGGTSKAGLTDYLLEFHPRYLILDEIDKMALSEMSILLSLMESGTVTRLKKRMRETEHMVTTVFAAANRGQHIWPEMKSRFFTVHLQEYTVNDFIMIVESVLVNREKVEPTLARYIADVLISYTRDVREAIHIGRLAKNEDDVTQFLKLRFRGTELTQ